MIGIVNSQNQILCGPVNYDGDHIRNLVFRMGGNSAVVPQYEPASVVKCGALAIMPVSDPCTDVEHPEFYIPSIGYWYVNDGVITRDLSLNERDITDVRSVLIDNLSEIRWNCECGGIVFDEKTISTSRDDRSALLASAQSIADDASIQWKTQSGFISLDKQAINELLTAVTQHVNRCFTAEKNISDQIDAETSFTTLTNLNLTELFDSEYQAQTS
ncbi:DUF4376 domain-containing protein [Vibrio quintilis]|uniref:DUF4376 domain-containing protein n=1 Tax=Vibrio quintilis TaxID=1117707 RepID=A0A1M7YZ33_9VIBR|nr:DUF4376 domain-containing protein [Vibrio quintilis]SHO57901.1 hypothetical protein VQ7734_03671 [Vibrio quintilis]